MQLERVTSGVPGLDEILHGGFVDGLPYLVGGVPTGMHVGEALSDMRGVLTGMPASAK